MNLRYKIMAAVLVILLIGMVILQTSKSDELNWFPSYAKTDKIPLGTFVFYDLLNDELPAEKITEVRIPPFEFMEDSMASGSYFFLNEDVSFDPAETKKILNWVGGGNTLFVSATYPGRKLLDTLNVEIASFHSMGNLVREPLLNLSNPKLKREMPYYMDKDLGSSYFKSIDTATTTVLGVYDILRDEDSTTIKEPKVNFIEVPFKEGKIYLHLFPQAFTNYFMLHGDNNGYTNGVLAYLPTEKNLFIDQYYKNGKTFNTSPLFVILNNRYLKWAYYTLLIIGLLWVFFEGKRKQRSIPVIEPLANQSLDFTRTIAGMYLENKDHKKVAQHQVNHFLEHVRSRYRIRTVQLDDEFVEQLAAKSDIPTENIKKLVDLILLVRQQPEISEQDLIDLNREIEKFKAKA